MDATLIDSMELEVEPPSSQYRFLRSKLLLLGDRILCQAFNKNGESIRERMQQVIKSKQHADSYGPARAKVKVMAAYLVECYIFSSHWLLGFAAMCEALAEYACLGHSRHSLRAAIYGPVLVLSIGVACALLRSCTAWHTPASARTRPVWFRCDRGRLHPEGVNNHGC